MEHFIYSVFTNFCFQILFSIGMIVLFGFMLTLLTQLIIRSAGRAGLKLYIFTAFFGTPIHELGHAFFCVIFGHKINSIKLFAKPTIPDDAEEVTVGEVVHSYNPRNIYQQIGNFFIGIGPIIFGSAVITLIMLILTPDIFNNIFTSISQIGSGELGFNSETFSSIASLIPATLSSLFSMEFFSSWKWWVFIVAGILIAMHMKLSSADISGAKLGLIIFLILILLVDIIIYFINSSVLSSITFFILKYSIYIGGLMLITMVFLVILWILTSIIGAIFSKR